MSNDPSAEILGRRNLLGRSAALAGTAAAGAIAFGVAGSRTAAADTGDALIAGSPVNRAHTPTWLTYARGEDPAAAALILDNQTGPALQLLPIPEGSQDGKKEPFGSDPGCFFATEERPVYRAADEKSGFAVGLATLDDLDLIQEPQIYVPQRILDTTKGYVGDVADTVNFDSSGRLKAGRYVDVAVGRIDRFTVRAVFLNVHSTGATSNGVLSVYPPGEAKLATVHFTRGVTVANFTVAPVVLRDTREGGPTFFVRIHTSATTHVQVDLLGDVRDGVISDPNSGVPSPLQHKTKRTRRPRSSSRRIGNKLKSPH